MRWLTRDWSGTCVSCGRQRRTAADIDRALDEYDGTEPAWWAQVCWWVDAAMCSANQAPIVEVSPRESNTRFPIGAAASMFNRRLQRQGSLPRRNRGR